MRGAAWLWMLVGLWSAAATAAAQRMPSDRAARLAEAERALAEERYEEAQATLDELAAGLEVEEPVLAARLELELRRAGLFGAGGAAASVPAAVESAAAALERRTDVGHRGCLLLADEAVAAGRTEAAAGWLRRALERRPDDDRARLRLALLEMGRGRTDEAARLALELLERHARCPGILQLAGQALLAEGRAEAALDPLQRLVRVAPELAEGRALLATALLVERRFEEAVTQYERAVALEPTPARRAALGLALTLAGRSAEAIPLLERLTEEHPEHVGAWNNLGVARAAAGRFEEARAALRRALELDPGDAQARANLADLDARTPTP
ncbi:MAG: tetratricopeptide repeat protein [Myxococcales bacterium]|nr:tetratricopeptide repeat protein [Myxococcales bacterium]